MGIKHLDITYSIRRDEDLWKDLKSGSSQALEVIYDKYIDSLLAYGRCFVGNQTILEDCVQDVFTEIWIKRDRLGNTDSINFYLIKCLKLKIFKAVKKEQSEISATRVSDYFQLSDEDDDSHNNELFRKLQDALESLNPRQKEIIIMKFYNQLSTHEICNILEMTTKQVYNDTTIAFKKIREFLLYLVLAFILSL